MNTLPIERIESEAVADREDSRLDEYRAALRSFDHGFEMADDASVYRAGVQGLAKLHAMQAEVDPNGALWLMTTKGIFGAHAPRVGVFA